MAKSRKESNVVSEPVCRHIESSMKPCYCYGKELLVLAEVIEEGEELWQSCTVRISQGALPKNTMISKKVAERAGWWTMPDGEASQETPVVVHCKLRVGRCELSTDVHVMDEEALSDQCVPFEWHIHLGQSLVEALVSASWDADICYLNGVIKEGLDSLSTRRASCCRSFVVALDSGHAACARYWHGMLSAKCKGKVKGDEDVRLNKSAMLPSAEGLMHAHDVLGLSWGRFGRLASAAAGSIACLSYLHLSGCPWDAWVCRRAAEAGKTASLVYAHEHGCAWDGETCAAAARHGHLDCLMYARTHGCQWDEETCRCAAKGGNLEILKYAYEHGCLWDASTCAAAAAAGSMECLVYAHELGCPWTSTTCDPAAEGRRPKCPAHGHEKDCVWDDNALYEAAMAGHLDCLIYAHKHGCPYDIPAPAQYCDSGLISAAVEGEMSLPCLKYVHENMGCTWHASGDEWQYAFYGGRCDVLEYVHTHGGAWCGKEELRGEMHRCWDFVGPLEEKASCLLYMHCCGGCNLPPLRGKNIGKRVLTLLQERRAAVLLSFRAADRAQADNCSASAAAHAAMAMVPADLIRQIICSAKLQPID